MLLAISTRKKRLDLFMKNSYQTKFRQNSKSKSKKKRKIVLDCMLNGGAMIIYSLAGL